jgi:protoporphyrinogen oxidase
MNIEEWDTVILGGGLCGLAAASVLGDRAVVLERDDRPGGLVKTDCFDGYWFDHVLHLLYFADESTRERISTLLGQDLTSCRPEAWVECSAGVTRYPLQTHLAGLDSNTVIDCLEEFVAASHNHAVPESADFERMLLHTFGKTMCEVFFFPYNSKVWKMPLSELVASEFTWNIAKPDIRAVISGALGHTSTSRNYNASGWYPRPPQNANWRGMEVLSRALAARTADLRVNHRATRIDLARREVTVEHGLEQTVFRYREACLGTLPLPQMLRMCSQTPEDLRVACASLRHNKVLSAALSVRGPRPLGRGHWRYYSDESLVFTRLIYLHEFDPYCAPDDGWSLLAEITEPGEAQFFSTSDLFARVKADIERVGGLGEGCAVVDEHLLVADPAYVIFTPESVRTLELGRRFLAEGGVTPLGRYGRWEYSSMGQVMRDGFAWADSRLKSEA